jgi:hypothetical protein
METESILDRVAKLLAKAKSTTNEHEAALFADKAAELLAKHNLDEAMLRSRDADREQGPVGSHSYGKRSPDRWREMILQGCAALYFCKLTVSPYIKSVGRHQFIGREHNAKVAMLMADYLIATTKRLAREHSPHKADQNDFRKGCALTLYHRMHAMRAEMSKPVSNTTGTNALVIYDAEDKAIAEFMAGKFGKASKRSGIKLGASGAAGRAAGERISLNTQVTETRASRMLR